MPTRRSEPSLLLLAVIGLTLYLGVTFLSPFLTKSASLEEDKSGTPAISKAQASQAAEQFALKQLSLTANRQTNVIFQSYSARSGYVQKIKLYDDYLKRYGDRFPLDYYQVEINDLNSKATYYIDVNFTTKEIMGWELGSAGRTGTAPASSGEGGSESLARKTLKDMGYLPEEFVLKDSSEPKSGRYLFESKTEAIGEAHLQVLVSVTKGKVTSFHPRFSVPDSFLTWQQAQNDRAALMTRVSMGISLLMSLSAVYVMVRYRREITFVKGTVLSLLFLAVYVMNNFNMLPAFRTSHGEGPSGPETLFYLWFMNIFVGLLALSTYFALSAGRRLWQNRGVTAWPSWRQAGFGASVKSAMVRGYLICLFVLGVQQLLFFIAGEAFDVWAVSDPSDSVFNMLYPAAFPLMAWAAAISEEAVYRLFGIAFFLKITKNRFLAVLLPSIIWAMSHTQYPIYPVYTRLIEVTVLGLIFGYAFLRYGFLTALFAHAAMDSILMGLSLMYMGGPMQVITGGAYLLLPALIGWLIYWIHGKLKRRPPSPPAPARPLFPRPDH
ncbi:CPBP family intramembrane metalloprotease [Paenibacillus filicis]|uniref:CPBP family intramembrane metalloprotease n=1 Tax=Paenibacillus gyeongsangnamensis TaxID=3388067 RepID=A0ABT4QIW3_9BACL|nr:CPBP family intramembrane glutamic endopeptidase [Paenibacillus filicis]MCZ8516814.1 CPBP family intramembrane metalloprotease [Paenibacillus filicis]